ncbi:hypothetical protein PABG_11143 [Paracoccidioides brasiliensis Pb03]|nr:hypothetical protein PABG_11143 [Paracoccidioides brasiliensis Pb03]
MSPWNLKNEMQRKQQRPWSSKKWTGARKSLLESSAGNYQQSDEGCVRRRESSQRHAVVVKYERGRTDISRFVPERRIFEEVKAFLLWRETVESHME